MLSTQGGAVPSFQERNVSRECVEMRFISRRLLCSIVLAFAIPTVEWVRICRPACSDDYHRHDPFEQKVINRSNTVGSLRYMSILGAANHSCNFLTINSDNCLLTTHLPLITTSITSLIVCRVQIDHEKVTLDVQK